MMRLLKSTILCAAVAATALTALPASARDWHHGGGNWHHGGYRSYGHNHGGDALAAGIAGLAVGALAAGVLAPRPEPVYVDPYPRPAPYPVYRYHPYRPAPHVVYYNRGYEPWTPAWYDACSDRYRSFDPRSGTYLGYDGQRHLCNIN